MERYRTDKTKRIIVILFILILLLAVSTTLLRRRGTEPETGEVTPLDLEFVDFVCSLGVSDEVAFALLEQGYTELPFPTIQWEDEVIYQVISQGEATSVPLRFTCEGISPYLLFLEISDWTPTADGAGDETLKELTGRNYVLGGKSYSGSDRLSLLDVEVSDCPVVVDRISTIIPRTGDDGKLIKENGLYVIDVKNETGCECGARFVPGYVYVSYDPSSSRFSLKIVSLADSSSAHTSDVIFAYKGQHSGNGSGSGTGSGDGPSDPTPGSGDTGTKCNHSGCNEFPRHCIWCHKWHCIYHKCTKLWGYEFWCDTQTQDYDTSAYARAYAYFIEGEGASNYKKWKPEYEAYGVSFGPWYDD